MNFIELHIYGGLEFTLTLLALLAAIVTLSILKLLKSKEKAANSYWIRHGAKRLGLFSFFFGLLGQVIGLMSAFQAIETAGEIAQGVLAGGLFVSFITTAYGLFNLLISLLLEMIVGWRLSVA